MRWSVNTRGMRMRPMSLRWIWILMSPIGILFVAYYLAKYITIAVLYVLVILYRLTLEAPIDAIRIHFRYRKALRRLQRRYGS